MFLFWHKYKYFPYEKELAIREVQAIFPGVSYTFIKNGIEISASTNDPLIQKKLSRLVYFSSFGDQKHVSHTIQGKLEATNQKRQTTRYSSHGIHEYKGKFNPQIVHALLNIFSVMPGQRVLDPFCGSGTTLLECTHLGINSDGTDINPLAVFIANAKQEALETPAQSFISALRKIETSFRSSRKVPIDCNTSRNKYLLQWFDPSVLSDIETLRALLIQCPVNIKNYFLTIASNLLREYSFQDPNDLRIRRRKTPIPTTPFFEQFTEKAIENIKTIEMAQDVLGPQKGIGQAHCLDIRSVGLDSKDLYDFVVTSPPYATALPYIDTQRLSLVWLEMIKPDQIMTLDMSLIGSREIRNKQLQEGMSILELNEREIPKIQYEFCQKLNKSVSKSDGFRRQAVPYLMYRYFADMRDMFITVHKLVKKDSFFALVVGSNHTTLGGTKITIDTPLHLSWIAQSCKWDVQETINLQTYQRYGYNIRNATTSESLLVLRAK